MTTPLLSLILALMLVSCATARDHSQVWFNYQELQLGENQNWEEVVTIRSDTLFVAGEWVLHATESEKVLGDWEQAGIALRQHLGNEKDNNVRGERAIAWLKKYASSLFTGEITILRPGILHINRAEDGWTRMNVRYYEDVNQDPRDVLEVNQAQIIQALSEGGWVRFTNGQFKIIHPANLWKTLEQLEKIRSGVPDEELDLNSTGINDAWLKALREEG